MEKLPGDTCQIIKTAMTIREKKGRIYSDNAYKELKRLTLQKLNDGLKEQEAIESAFKNYEYALRKRYNNGEFPWRENTI